MSINFPDAPTTGDLFTSGGQGWRWDGTKWTSGTQGPTGVKGDGVNILRRNGGFEVWQRGAGGSASFAYSAMGTGVYNAADGWYTFLAAAGMASVVSQQPGIVNGSQYSLKYQRNAGQTGASLGIIGFPLDTDELYPILGQYVRLSFTAKAGANWSPASGSLQPRFLVGTSTPAKQLGGYPGEVTVLSMNAPLTTTATRFQVTSSSPVPTNARQADLQLLWTAVGTAGADDSFTIDDVQLEIVPAATGYVSSDFQRLNFAEQLLLCQRHYQKTFPYSVAPVVNAGSANGDFRYASTFIAGATGFGFYRPMVPFRVNPSTGVIYNTEAANNLIRNGTRSLDLTTCSFASLTANEATVIGIAPAGQAVGDILRCHLSFDAGI